MATLGHSRRLHVRAYGHEERDSWFDGIKSAFAASGSLSHEVLLDNALALIMRQSRSGREVMLHPRLHAFARHWDLWVRACAPYGACMKGSDERCVGFVTSKAIAGCRFAAWSEMGTHPACWMREIADLQMHGMTGEPLRLRFERDEAAVLLDPLLPPISRVERLPAWPLRELVNAIFYALRGGIPWRMLPPCLPPRQTVYGWFAAWRNAGVWQSINHRLVMLDRERVGRDASPSAAVTDSQSVKATEAGGPRGYEAGKSSWVASARCAWVPV